MLRYLGFRAISICGELSEIQRIGVLNKFMTGECNILTCTELASRGLDFPAVDLVINYDIPAKASDYIHRVGRTARAGRSGVAIALVSQYELGAYYEIERLIGKKLLKYPVKEDEALLLHERVTDANRLAEAHMKSNGGKGRKRGKSDDDGEGGSLSFGRINKKSTYKKATY